MQTSKESKENEESKENDVRKENIESKEEKKEIAKQNLRKFIKAGGFKVLHNCMNIVFKDLENSNYLNLFKNSLD